MKKLFPLTDCRAESQALFKDIGPKLGILHCIGFIQGQFEKNMETSFLYIYIYIYRDHGKENGNYYTGLNLGDIDCRAECGGFRNGPSRSFNPPMSSAQFISLVSYRLRPMTLGKPQTESMVAGHFFSRSWNLKSSRSFMICQTNCSSFHRGYIRTMETTIIYWGYTGIMEKKSRITIKNVSGLYRDNFGIMTYHSGSYLGSKSLACPSYSHPVLAPLSSPLVRLHESPQP